MGLLSNKVILITGSSSKIGSELASFLAEEGAKLILHYHKNSEKISTLSEQIAGAGGQAKIISQDLLAFKQLKQFVENSIGLYGKVDVLINNAAYWPEPEKMAANQGFFEQTLEDWDLNINTNLKAPFFLSQHLSSELIKRQGTIINILDCNEQHYSRFAYAISKKSLAYMTEILAKTLEKKVKVEGIFLGKVLPDKQMKEAEKARVVWQGMDYLEAKVKEILS
ncbi:MAG: SDR family NAD(P)-dependent oxidoreductase [Proteobacteria bacterium]|nr:SDR family NAD(P)-dependent oxidoreductase [Pseudomonadota bacterium]